MDTKPVIDHAVDDKIDEKIQIAQLPVDPIVLAKLNLDTAENKASRTTLEEDRRSAGQRDINKVWEDTQRMIALFVVFVGCVVAAFVVIVKVWKDRTTDPLGIAAFTLLSNICFLVAGFYFGRTNHARIGDEKEGSSNMDDR